MHGAFLRLLFPVAIGLHTASLRAQDLVPWSADRPLAWSDFRGLPPDDVRSDAYTCYRVSATIESDPSGRIEARVMCRFLPEESWVRPSARSSMRLLAHEQLHFDLAEVHARRFAAELPVLLVAGDVEAALGRAHDRMMARLRKEQARYDRETDHGRNAAAQARWSDLVHRLLR